MKKNFGRDSKRDRLWPRYFVRSVFCIACALALAGCVPLIYHCNQGQFEGIEHQLARTNVPAMHFLLVHGMQTHRPGYSSNLINNLTRKLNAELVASNPAEDMVSPFGDTNQIREVTYRLGSKMLYFHELTWSPTTASLKANAFEYDNRLDKHRSVLNRWMKDALLNDGFGDAMLYLNPQLRPRLQAPIAQAMHRVMDKAADDDAIVLIAASLGSKMSLDTVSEVDREQAKLKRFAAQTTGIIMLANQVPLLGLTTSTNLAEPSNRPGHSLRRFIQEGHDERQRRPAQKWAGQTNGVFTINILAATDPNDLLSYPLERKDFTDARDGTRVHVANTFSHNAWAIFGVFEWPATAHTAYDENSRVLKDMINGVDQDKDCLPAGAPKKRQSKSHF